MSDKSVELTLNEKCKLRNLWNVCQPIRDDMYHSMTTEKAQIRVCLLFLRPDVLGLEETLV